MNVIANNFRNFLTYHKAYDKFCFNLMSQHGLIFNDLVSGRVEFRSLIDHSLSWGSTPEGHGYWSNLSMLWNDSLDQGTSHAVGYKSIW